MTHEEFEALVGRLEEQARRRPRTYKLRVVLLAMLGYAYLIGIVGLLVALVAAGLWVGLHDGIVAFKLIVAPAGLLAIVLRALWVRLSRPEGSEIRREDAPALFQRIDALRRKLRAPRVHCVLVTPEFNAGVVQIPRLGVFGWHRNYLTLGLPLMRFLTPEQLEAVLAHEFGHLAGGHSRLSGWLYRVRQSWQRLMTELDARKARGAVLFRKFFDWYAPYFSAWSFPLARANEYEADAASARLVSARAAAEALTGTNVIGRYLAEHFWPHIYEQAADRPRPAFAPFSEMRAGWAPEIDPSAASGWLEGALSRATTLEDTHPSLADRLAALGEAPRLALPEPGCGADQLLGDALPAISRTLDRGWQQAVTPSWEKRHQEVQAGRERLAELDALAGRQELSLTDAFERANLTGAFGASPEDGLEQLRALHERAPEDAVVSYYLGKSLLERDDEAGVDLLQRAMDRDEEAIAPACEVIRDYCWRNERWDEARAWNERLWQRQQLLRAIEAERGRILIRDHFEAHGLSAEPVAELAQRLRAIPGLRKAYLVRKRLLHSPDQPLFVLGFFVGRWWRPHDKKKTQRVQRTIVESISFPGQTKIISLEGRNYRFGRKFRRVRGARIV